MRARKYAEDHEEIADWLTGVPSSVKKEKRGTDPRKNNDVQKITLQQQDNSGLAEVVWAAKEMKKQDRDDTLVSFGPSLGRAEGSIQQSINGANFYPSQRNHPLYQSSRALPQTRSAMNIAYQEDNERTSFWKSKTSKEKPSEIFKKSSTKSLIGSSAFSTTKRNLFDGLEPKQNNPTSKTTDWKSADTSSGILKQQDQFYKAPIKKTVSWGPTTVQGEASSLFKKSIIPQSKEPAKTSSNPFNSGTQPSSIFSYSPQKHTASQSGQQHSHSAFYTKNNQISDLEERAKLMSLEMRKAQNKREKNEQMKREPETSEKEMAKSLRTLIKIAKEKVERSQKRAAARDHSLHKEKFFLHQFNQEILTHKKHNPSYTGAQYKPKRDLSLRWKFWSLQKDQQAGRARKAMLMSQNLIERESRIPLRKERSQSQESENEQRNNEKTIKSFLRDIQRPDAFPKEKLLCSDQLTVRVELRQYNKLLGTLEMMLNKQALLEHVQEAIDLEIERKELFQQPWELMSLSRQGRELRGSTLKKAGVKNNNEIIVAQICFYDEATHVLEEEEESEEEEVGGVWKPVLNPAFRYSPSRKVLNSMSKTQLRHVSNLVIQDPRFGRIQYLEPVDLVLTNHIRDIYFAAGEIDVYRKYKQKPQNYKLNKPCDFYLYQFNIEDYETIDEFEDECRENCEEQNVSTKQNQIEYLGLEEDIDGRVVVHMRCQEW